MTNLTYKDENNNDVFTSQYLKNKRTCCKSTCLHCPYGYTLKAHGIEFTPVSKESMDRANQIISPPSSQNAEESVATSLLASAFGGSTSKKKSNLITSLTLDKYFFISLKGRECGVVKKGLVQISQIYLKEHFQDQGLDVHIVDTYFNQQHI